MYWPRLAGIPFLLLDSGVILLFCCVAGDSELLAHDE